MLGITQDVPDRLDPKADERWAASWLPILLVVGLLAKLAVAALAGHLSPDGELLKAWCMRLARGGPFGFFDAQDIPNAAPGSLHPLFTLLMWPLGLAWRLFDPSFLSHGSSLFTVWVRLPAILADAACFLALWRIAQRYVGPRQAVITGAVVYLSPVSFLASAVWGQSDSTLLALILWGVVSLLEARFVMGVALCGIAGVVHMHALVLLPIAFLLAGVRAGWGKPIAGAAIAAFTFLVVGFMLAPQHPWAPYIGELAAEPYTTYHAFNVWYPLGNLANGWDRMFPAVPGSRHAWSALVVFSLMALGAFRVTTRENDSDFLRELLLLTFGAFMFSTRVHARYALYVVSLLALFPGQRPSFWLFTLSATANLLWPLGLSVNWGQAVMGGWGLFLSAWHLILYLKTAMQGTESSEEELHFTSRPVEDHEVTEKTWLEPESGIVKLDRLDVILILILSLSFGALRHYNLAAPPDTIFDEVYHAKAADEIWKGKAPNEWVHPPLAKLIIGIGIQRHGMNSYGWRFMPWLFGCLVLPVLYVLARNLIPNRRGAAIATLLLALDGCYFVLSRTAMTNVFAVLFQLSALTFFLLYLKQASVKGGKLGYGGYLFAAALCAGLGISTRWTCLWLIASLAAGYGLHTVWAFWRGIHTAHLYPGHQVLAFALATVSGILHFILIPGAMYLASYYPLVATKAYPDWHYVVSLQPQIWNFHTTFTTHHPYYSQWYTWVFTYRPVWYHYKDVEGQIHGILALGNPALWWISLPCVLAATWLAWRRRDWFALYAPLCWAMLYLPWVLSPRVLNYSHYYLEPLPYACIAIAWLMCELVARDKSFWLEVGVVVGIVALTFAFFYPIYACVPIPRKSYDYRIWSKNWI